MTPRSVSNGMKTKTKLENTGKQVYCSICSCYIPSASLVVSHEKGKKHQKLLNKKKQKSQTLNSSVYIRGFEKQLDLENQLRCLFSKYGPIKEIYVDKEKSDYALVEFEQETDAQKLLCEKDKQILNGKKLLVKPRKSHSEQDDSEKKHDGKGKTSKDEDDAWWASQKKILEDAFSKCKNVSDQMVALVDVMRLTEEESGLRTTLCELLKEVFKEVYPHCQVLAFGSSVTQLGCKGCDLDLTLIAEGLSDMKTRRGSQRSRETESFSSKDSCASSISTKTDEDISGICEILRRFVPGCTNVFPLRSAHCPIIKFHHKDSGLNCDLSMNNRLAVKNSELIRLYCKTDIRFRQLAYTIRMWAKSKDIAGKGRMQLTQYALVIMAISYLQRCEPPVLPCLQEVGIDSKEESEDCKIDDWDCYFSENIEKFDKSGNTSTIDKLLFGFFKYFSEFDYESSVVSIRTASHLTRESLQKDLAERGIEDTFKYGPVCVLDPFELTHNIAQNMTKDGLENFRFELRNAMQIFGNSFPGKLQLRTEIEDDKSLGNVKINSSFDLIKLFEPKQRTKEHKRKRKVKYVFDVYAGLNQESNDILVSCTDAIKDILQEDLKMHCKISNEIVQKTSVLAECLKEIDGSLKKEDCVERMMIQSEEDEEDGRANEEHFARLPKEDLKGRSKEERMEIRNEEDSENKAGNEFVRYKKEDLKESNTEKCIEIGSEGDEEDGRACEEYFEKPAEEGLKGDEKDFDLSAENEDILMKDMRKSKVAEFCRKNEDSFVSGLCEDAKINKGSVLKSEGNRKRKAIEMEELKEPNNKLAKISEHFEAKTLENSAKIDPTVVEIHATAWANTWTNRRQQRRILNTLKSDQSSSQQSNEESVRVLSNDPPSQSTDSGLFIATNSGHSESVCCGVTSSTGYVESLNTDPHLDPVPETETRIEATNIPADKGPIVVAKIRISKGNSPESRCRISVEMKEARNLTDFHTFFAFFKKQVLLKFKR